MHDDIPAYVFFSKDELGNYNVGEAEFGYIGIQPQNKLKYNILVYPLFRESKDGELVQLVISNHKNIATKLSVSLQNAAFGGTENEINVGKATAGILTSHETSSSYELLYRYYDANGKQLFDQ
ncbi:hypothetical protein [Bacillus sp. AFS017336]|uniref:hypothetical protein n=1 Tax=Bacillus sp. AFS017336 TaxID=2033489 RepID=UPI000BF17843|nr:hypothetical protein [Bacillus sp. AFS017336]PEL14269.1 hypothetical protein CN601_01610 [Bacillus sp. AFS017336]